MRKNALRINALTLHLRGIAHKRSAAPWTADSGVFVTARERLKLLVPGILLLSGFSAMAAPQVVPADGARVAVIAPGMDAVTLVAAAGGKAIATTDTGIIAVSDQPGFTGRLYRSGAWLVLRFDGLVGCLNPALEDYDNERG